MVAQNAGNSQRFFYLGNMVQANLFKRVSRPGSNLTGMTAICPEMLVLTIMVLSKAITNSPITQVKYELRGNLFASFVRNSTFRWGYGGICSRVLSITRLLDGVTGEFTFWLIHTQCNTDVQAVVNLIPTQVSGSNIPWLNALWVRKTRKLSI